MKNLKERQEVIDYSIKLNITNLSPLRSGNISVRGIEGGIEGCLLFNISKQSVNPGKNFGPYGLPKSALLNLCKQYAVDYGSLGIRSNGVNADRIRSGLLNDGMIKSRAKAREVSTDEYMRGNLLLNEVKAEDVAKAFFHLAVSKKTTGAVLTVDGGNIAASLR